jgi:aspartate 1-decarboxylase
MFRSMLKAKIHRATVTEADLNYRGSITVDRNLMDAAGLIEYEHVHIFDIDNGSRFETYVIEGERGSGVICLNGAAARLVSVGDKVIIANFATYSEEEVANHEPKLIYVDDNNAIDKKATAEKLYLAI